LLTGEKETGGVAATSLRGADSLRHDLLFISGSTKGMVEMADFTIMVYGMMETTANSLHE